MGAGSRSRSGEDRLEPLLGGVVVEERGLVGAEHVAGGIGRADVDEAAARCSEDNKELEETIVFEACSTRRPPR